MHVLEQTRMSPGLPAGSAGASRSAVTPQITAVVIGAYLALSVAFVLSLSIQLPKAGEQAVLLFAPGTQQSSAIDALQSHGGRFVAFGIADNVVVARFENDVAWSDLRAMNAWLSFDSASLIGCFVAPDS